MESVERLKSLIAFNGLKIVNVEVQDKMIVIWCKFRKKKYKIDVLTDGSVTLYEIEMGMPKLITLEQKKDHFVTTNPWTTENINTSIPYTQTYYGSNSND